MKRSVTAAFATEMVYNYHERFEKGEIAIPGDEVAFSPRLREISHRCFRP
jgi:hypothetical protein